MKVSAGRRRGSELLRHAFHISRARSNFYAFPLSAPYLGRAILQASGMSCRSLQSLKLACGAWIWLFWIELAFEPIPQIFVASVALCEAARRERGP